MLRYLFMALNLMMMTMVWTNGYVKCGTVHRYDTNKRVFLFYLVLLIFMINELFNVRNI